MSKVVLAFTGALDNQICIHWLRTVKNLKVVTYSGNLGQPEYLEPIGERAVESGATSAHIADLRERFIRGHCWPALRAGARYESGYVLSSALSRPLLAMELVRVAREEGCEAIAHGCRGIGNDQIRLETYIHTLAPELRILAPLQELSLKTPLDDEAYGKRWHLPRAESRQQRYNIDQNLWGVAIQLGQKTDPWMEPPPDTFVMTVPIGDAPDKPTYVEIGFDKGVPATLDGEAVDPVAMVESLNQLGGRYAIGRLDVIEDRISGHKGREVYEAPAASILHQAHTALEELTMDKEIFQFREVMSRRYADLVYRGKWFTPFREATESFFETAERNVTGTVKMKLTCGTCLVVGRQSPHSLYRAEVMNYDGDHETRGMRKRKSNPDSEFWSPPQP